MSAATELQRVDELADLLQCHDTQGLSIDHGASWFGQCNGCGRRSAPDLRLDMDAASRWRALHLAEVAIVYLSGGVGEPGTNE